MKVHPMFLQMWPIEPRNPIPWSSRDNFGGNLIPADEIPSWRQKSWLAPKIMPHLTNYSTSLPPCLGLGPKQKRKGSYSHKTVRAHHCLSRPHARSGATIESWPIGARPPKAGVERSSTSRSTRGSGRAVLDQAAPEGRSRAPPDNQPRSTRPPDCGV